MVTVGAAVRALRAEAGRGTVLAPGVVVARDAAAPAIVVRFADGLEQRYSGAGIADYVLVG